MSVPNPPKTQRVLELDALRAMAAVNLMLFHFTHVYCVKFGVPGELGFEWPYGKYGVQLFFMLSGFVNAMTLFRKKQPTDFVASRLIRVIPSFYAAIGLNLLLLTQLPFTLYGDYSLGQVAANLTLMPNLWGYECLEPVMWTLQVEIIFYGWLVLFFLSGYSERPLKPLLAWLIVCLVGNYWLTPLAAAGPANPSSQWAAFLQQLFLIKYLPLFISGILLHHLWSGRAGRWGAALGLLAALVVFHAIDERNHNPLATALLLGLLAAASFGKIPILRCWPFVFISSISYSLFLLHNNLGSWMMFQLNSAGLPLLASLGVATLLTVGFAAIVTWYFERPVSKVLRQFWMSQRPRIEGFGRILSGLAWTTAHRKSTS